MSEPTPVATPDINPETKPFWDAANEKILLVGMCSACGQAHFYPRRMCPHCGSQAIEWAPSSGRGTIYSYSVLRRSKTPYALSWVVLEEGVGLLTNIVDCDLDALAIGQDVVVTFAASESGQLVPFFAPVGETRA